MRRALKGRHKIAGFIDLSPLPGLLDMQYPIGGCRPFGAQRGVSLQKPAKGCALDIPPKSGGIREARSQEPEGAPKGRKRIAPGASPGFEAPRNRALKWRHRKQKSAVRGRYRLGADCGWQTMLTR